LYFSLQLYGRVYRIIYMSERSPNFFLYPGTVHWPFLTMFSTVSRMRG
jgi:hypothetical protein